ncbi:hypothetical protein B5D80_17660 [Micromonospora wenchangensis]|uniref:Uncharacterized protein n=1 Tax=Micromonospora wenchangensis TaxID=1185415 RepID=A0A246RLE1_9ACTN|nr:hypothetical protein B5D80_17660 [Micromonospora wenchangensis]
MLASRATTADTMAAPRKAGCAPRQQDADGRDVIERRDRVRLLLPMKRFPIGGGRVSCSSSRLGAQRTGRRGERGG